MKKGKSEIEERKKRKQEKHKWKQEWKLNQIKKKLR